VLALFIALMQSRNPAFDSDQNQFTEQFFRWMNKARHPSPDAVSDGFREYEQASGEDMTDVSPQEVFDMIRGDQYVVKNPRQNNIKLMVELSLMVAKALMTLNWDIVWTPKESSFITCDNPFTLVPPPNFDGTVEGFGILTPNATTIIPLSRKTGIYFSGEGGKVRYAVARKDFVRQIVSV
jgi:hypothetical protein